MIKRIIKIIISLFYFLYDKSLYYLKKLLNIKVGSKCVALYYHSIFDDEVKNFKKQIDLLNRKATILPSNYDGKLNNDKLYSIITFDDGYANLINNAIPILKEKKVPFTIFFVTNYLGKKPDWEGIEYYKEVEENLMTSQQMMLLPMEQLTIGSHTSNHKMLDKLSPDELEYELINSKETLEKLTGRKIELLSFPNGVYNKEVLKKSFEAGYMRVFTIEPKPLIEKEGEKIIGRMAVNGNDWLFEFWLKINGAYLWLSKIYKFRKIIYDFFVKD